ncbi:hypothetical protein HK100_000340 [Physocladia obscura]|uniref:Uncharacterized protein n=1 Tax=Physocladia obscura TaxID=109957 RepID=A0AAD5XF98_9FUNG|nr:hypothetical protein HK100_000340 [Physocladia obscura]
MILHTAAGILNAASFLKAQPSNISAKFGPRWRVWNRPVLPTMLYSTKERPEKEVNFFESIHQDEGISRDILTSAVTDAHNYEHKQYIYNPSRGNCLHIYELVDNGPRILLAAGGFAGNELS